VEALHEKSQRNARSGLFREVEIAAKSREHYLESV
jgi:hypothetical protein